MKRPMKIKNNTKIAVVNEPVVKSLDPVLLLRPILLRLFAMLNSLLL